MNFVDEKPKNSIMVKSASKSRLDKFQKCPQWLYRDIRSDKPQVESESLEIGKLAHEIAARKVREKFEGIEFDISDLGDRYDLDVIYEVLSNMTNKVKFDYLLKDQNLIAIEENMSVDLPQVSEDFKLLIKCDLVTFRMIGSDSYIVVYDWKSSFNISEKNDIEAKVYAYALSKKYAMPVIFNRVSLSTGKVAPMKFSMENINLMEYFLLEEIKKYKKEMESEVIPEFKPGGHCQYCPFITQCDGRKYISSLRHKHKAAIWAKELAKHLEKEVKEAANEVASKGIPTEEGIHVLLPFLDGRYGAVAKSSSSWGLAGRKITKKQVLTTLIRNEEIEDFIDLIDIKFNEELSAHLEKNYKLKTKKSTRTTISLQEVKEGDNDEF
jgi:CRISPR/Cas system-associated exonuclease Cas4 (RecB family)